MNEKIQEELAKALRSISRRIANVNYGGCGFAALYLNAALAALGIRSSIIEVGGGMHYVVKLGKTYLHQGGAFAHNRQEFEYNIRFMYLTRDHRRIGRRELRELLSMAWMWNSRYSRRLNPRLNELIVETVNRTVTNNNLIPIS